MSVIDPHASWAALERRAADFSGTSNDDRIAGLILTVRDHMACEIKGDVPGLMATLTDDPIYHFWGNGEPVVLRGRAVIEGFYQDMMGRGGNQFEVVIDNVVADLNHVITEGQVKQVYTADSLAAQELTDVNGLKVQSSELWLSCAQLITVWPNDGNGKLVGEDIYFGQSPLSTLVPVEHKDLPEYYQLIG